MKLNLAIKHLFLLVCICLAVACTPDEQLVDIDGHYRAQSLDLAAKMLIEDGRCIRFDAAIKGDAAGTWTQISTSGNYPDYTYTIGNLRIHAHFDEINSITARLDGVLRTEHADSPNMNELSLTFHNVLLKFNKQ